jgi:hypothetical protein
MKDEIIIYQANEASTRIEVQLAYETIWLSQAQIVALFESSKANISEHLKSIFKSKELNEDSVVRNFRTTASDGKAYEKCPIRASSSTVRFLMLTYFLLI